MDQQISDSRLWVEARSDNNKWPAERQLSQQVRSKAGTLEARAIWRGFAPLRDAA